MRVANHHFQPKTLASWVWQFLLSYLHFLVPHQGKSAFDAEGILCGSHKISQEIPSFKMHKNIVQALLSDLFGACNEVTYHSLQENLQNFNNVSLSSLCLFLLCEMLHAQSLILSFHITFFK